MKLHRHDFGERNVIRRCQSGTITVNERRFNHSVIITPQAVVEDWPPGTVAELTAAHLDSVARLGVDLVILGTGDRQVFPAVRILEPLMNAAVGYEIMDSPAAARTYNVVASEGRNVAAAILIG